jgi:hypothetical protein
MKSRLSRLLSEQDRHRRTFRPPPGEEALELGADQVREIFGDFEFHDGVAGVELNDTSRWFGRFGCNCYLIYLVQVAHRAAPLKYRTGAHSNPIAQPASEI